MTKLSPHFKDTEFRCPCCKKGGSLVNPKLVAKLEILRTLIGDKPINITSGYRCSKHNKEVGGIADSQHLKNNAVDFYVKNMKPYDVYYYANKVFWDGGVGIYKTHIHVDVGKKQRWQNF